jgi:DNA-binding NtrC family response regulator/tetratricopeptide (TPR) repeat protein
VATASVQSNLARANAALERGRGSEAAQLLLPQLRGGSLTREDELAVRASLTEAWLLQDDLVQAASALGRPPDALRERISDAQLSTLWRLHGRITFARGEHSRAIALHSRALKHAELAHESRSIGLAHYELAVCYKQVGDSGIVRDHLTEAASALHAAGDRRHLAFVHSLSAVLLAQSGRPDEADTTLRQGERLAMAIHADDALAGIVHNQANVALMKHRHDQALALAERSVALHQSLGSGHGLAVALATLGQICVQLGDLERAEQILTRTLEVRSPIQFHETTGAVFDTLAQIHLMRGSYERAGEYLRLAGEAYGAWGTTMRWYEWSLKVLGAKLAIRRGAFDEALEVADQLAHASDVPPSEAIQADLAACEALVAGGRVEEAAQRLVTCEGRLDPRGAPANWGEFLRIRGLVHEQETRHSAAYHDFAQSANVFELLGERYQAALSHLSLGRLAAKAGTRQPAERYLELAASVFQTLGAQRDLDEIGSARALLDQAPTVIAAVSPNDADEAIVRRLVDAAIFPELLARETATALFECTIAGGAVVFVAPPGGEARVVASSGCDASMARGIATAAAQGRREFGAGFVITESLGRDHDGARSCSVFVVDRPSDDVMRRLRMFTAVARQGFELCGVRERPPQLIEQVNERPLEPLLPGFICASAAMNRVAEQIQRLQGHNLTVLITGESGTGKDLVARAIHGGSPRSAAMFLPYNCTTTTRDLADSQLFGHRRGSFTGAITDQQGLIRSAAGGTLFLDEIGDLPLDIQPKLLRFLEQGEVMPVGETRPQGVDVRVLAATNADLEQRVAEGKFREDLYYRLSVIRIVVPPLRDRREEIPHLSTYFLREASERLAKPDVHMSSATLDLFARYWWPGNVRQLRNEIQRAVAMSAPGGVIEPDQLSPDLAAPPTEAASAQMGARPIQPGNLASAVEAVERDLITATLDHTAGNISETARVLGLTRRGLYLKMRRLHLGGEFADSHSDTQ